MPLHRRNAVKLGGVLIVALAVALSSSMLLAQSGKVEVHWLGQAAFKITTPTGKVIVLDPFLTQNPKTPADYKDLAKLGNVDLILITHGHGDHVGDVKDLAARNSGAKVYGPAGLIATLTDLGWIKPEQGVRFGKGGKVQPLGPQITITQVRAEHSSELTVTDPVTKKSTTHPGGEPAGFIIQMENGFKLYHMGDTGLFGDMKLIADYYKPDLVLMPIGGHFVMDPQDAAFATREWLKPKFVIPMHYGTFPVLKGTPDRLKHLVELTGIDVLVLKPGETAS